MQIKETLGFGNKPLEGRDRPGGASRNGDGAATRSGAEAQAAAAGDRAEFSGRSRELAKASETLSATPAVRQEKVAEIRRRLDNNEYQVDSEKVAGKMIVDFLREMV